MSRLQYYNNAGQDEYPDDDNNSIFDDTPSKKQYSALKLRPAATYPYSVNRSTSLERGNATQQRYVPRPLMMTIIPRFGRVGVFGCVSDFFTNTGSSEATSPSFFFLKQKYESKMINTTTLALVIWVLPESSSCINLTDNR
jgi:hypothetical protein